MSILCSEQCVSDKPVLIIQTSEQRDNLKLRHSLLLFHCPPHIGSDLI